MRHVRNIGLCVLVLVCLFPSLGRSTSLLVSWVADTDADLSGYRVYYGTQSGSYSNVADVQTALSYKISNVQHGLTYYVAVSSYDTFGNESSKSPETSVTIPAATSVVDTTPPTGSVSINSGASTTSSSTVTLTMSASDAGGTVTGMKISNDGSSYSIEYAYGTSCSWTLSSGYGKKTVYVLYKDSAGNWMTTPATASIQVVDSTLPTGSVSINSGASTTSSSTVTLTMSASDAGGTVTGMKISNDGSSYSIEYAYGTSCSWTLSSGYGKKTVYVLYKDSAGNWMTTPATASIQVVDSTLPTGSVSINSGASTTSSSTVTLTMSASDAGGTVTGMKISNDGSSYSIEYAYGTSCSWTLSSGYGKKTVYVLYKDSAGNWMTTPATASIQVVDSTLPTGSVSINSGASTTSSSTVTLTMSASDAGGTVTGMKISNDGSSYSIEYAYGTSCSWTLSSGYGKKTVYVLYKDSAGNWMTTPATATIQVIEATSSAGSLVINNNTNTSTTTSTSSTTTQTDTSQVKPEITSPQNNAVEISLTPVLKTADLANSYSLTEWEISNDNGDVLFDLKSSTQRTELTVSDLILDPAMKHYCRVRYYDSKNNVTQWSDPVAFVTVQIDPKDLNQNGIPDDQELTSSEEKAIAQGLDKSSMKALVSVVGGEDIVLTKSANCKEIEYFESIDPSTILDTTGKPKVLPIGLIDFKIEVTNPGDTAEVIVTLSEPAPVGAKWYMYSLTKGWWVYPYAVFSDDRMEVTLQLKDGDPDYGDTDGVANGIIVDPGGIGAGSTKYSSNSNDSLCFIDTSIHYPSLQGASAALIVIMILLFAGIDRRHRKKNVL